MEKYNHTKIEKKWQRRWGDGAQDRVDNNSQSPKSYLLIEFPYPSGDGLHVGHVRPYTALDVVARKRRAEGKNVLFPIGWDAFGLPTENYAIKTGIHPQKVTAENTARFKKQIQSLGISFDWSREINTTDPAYYKWTQWIFLQFYKKGLAYKDTIAINWCLSCKIGLANEEIVDGKCERCGGETEKREKEQWMLAITKYADCLDKDLDDVDYPEHIKRGQRNWIGRSQGAEISFQVAGNSEQKITVFTTRPDTLFGATYLVLSPEHPHIQRLKSQITNWNDIARYIEQAKKKTETERTTERKEKTGVELKGVKAVNPGNKEEVPVFVADYVLGRYGTGAIMAVPAHDERDFAFAKTFNLPIRQVIQLASAADIPRNAEDIAAGAKSSLRPVTDLPYTGDGELLNSGGFSGMASEEVKEKIVKAVGGEMKTTYKLRDWVFSRQRYWGEPIPMIHCATCGWIPVPEDALPVLLPDVKNYKPTESGESPLADIAEWVNTTCPRCKGHGKRETDTMPNWAGSSWYYLRYSDPHNEEEFASRKNMEKWLPVDWYNGGMEHTTLHLLYSRFWHKFLYDEGLVPTHEPYVKRTSHGLILAEGGEKMSKSKGNTVNPDVVVEKVGADTLRVYEMFLGPFEQAIPWNTEGIAGPRRFLERTWKLYEKVRDGETSSKLQRLLQKTVLKVGEDIENIKFNTAVSSLMILLNELEKQEYVPKTVYVSYLQLLAPFAPHIASELWETLGMEGSVQDAPWPNVDRNVIHAETVVIVVQINGKVRERFEAPIGARKEEIEKWAYALNKIKAQTEGRKIIQTVYVPNKLLNIVL